MKLEYAFPSTEAASDFIQSVMNERREFVQRRRNAGPFPIMPFSRFEVLAQQKGGQIYFSTSRKETNAYHYQQQIFPDDRRYLYERDPTLSAIVDRIPVDTWNRLPKTFVPAVDSFFDELQTLGFVKAVVAADQLQRRDGGAFVYINASGDPSQPLRAGDVWHGFDFIEMAELVEDSILMREPGDSWHPLWPTHGISSLEIYRDSQTKTEKITIHGSRLINIIEDPKSKTWFGRAKVDSFFDQLWNLRDVEHAQTSGQFKGNPIVVEVNIEAEYTANETDDETIVTELVKWRDGAIDSFGPVEGVSFKRVGAPELDDPSNVIKLLYSRIAVKTEFPVNMLIASSRGSEQVTDQDRRDYIENLTVRRQMISIPLLAQVFRLGQYSNKVPRRLSLPSELDWPIPLTMLRDVAVIDNRDAATLHTAFKSGHTPPDRILRKFQRNTEPFNFDTILPSQPKQEEDDVEESSSNPSFRDTIKDIIEQLVESGELDLNKIVSVVENAKKEKARK